MLAVNFASSRKCLCGGKIFVASSRLGEEEWINFKILNQTCVYIVLRCTVIQSPVICAEHFESHQKEVTVTKFLGNAVNHFTTMLMHKRKPARDQMVPLRR